VGVNFSMARNRADGVVFDVSRRRLTRRPDDERRTKNALRLWDDSVDPRGTLAERYFASRSLDLPCDLAGKLIRFHRNCPMEKERHPATRRILFLPKMRCSGD
jgi:putative DNA primase/helicase